FCTGIGWLLRRGYGAAVAHCSLDPLHCNSDCRYRAVQQMAGKRLRTSRDQGRNRCGCGYHSQDRLDHRASALQRRQSPSGDAYWCNGGRTARLCRALSPHRIAHRRCCRMFAAGAVVNIVLLYLLLLKGTVTAFAGLASLPVIQHSLVEQYHVLTNEQLNEAVVITRSTPGPVGLWVVSAGYFAAGIPGAIAGWLAMITPALLIIPMVHFVGRKMENPRVESILRTVVIASAGLLLAAAIPLGRDGLTGPATIAIAVTCFVLLLATKLDTLWMILGPAIVSLTLSSVGLVALI